MPEFTPINDNDEQEINESNATLVLKATDEAEIQEQETRRIKSKQEAVLAENNIKDVEELQERLRLLGIQEAELKKNKEDWENTKATELSDIQRQKSQLEQATVDINKKEQELAGRVQSLAIREKLVEEREEMLNKVERQKLQDEEKYNSLLEQLKRGFPEIKKLLGKSANELIRCGFRRMGNQIWDEIEKMSDWYDDDIEKHCKTMIKWMHGEIEDCNQKAVFMSRNSKSYQQVHWDKIVDNLEKIYVIMPVLRPEYLPKDEG